ncbi:MAG: hypothetical protein O7B35_15495, partial [Deltaproteobacteria bacterium]|nr:hypothetical protein [Deltaproteobacteria bacterium]
LGEKRLAEATFNKALRERSLSMKDHAGVHTDLGLLLKKNGRTSDARREFELALRFDPESKQAHKELEKLR